MPLAYWCILVAALLPLALVAYAKAGSSENNTPRDAALTLQGAQRRAYAAHQNAYENFPFFAAAVIIAVTMGAPLSTINWLALGYVAIRIIHGLLYVADKASLRSLSYAVGLIINVAIFVLPAFK
jgi:uncharacterized MAPEG superfamily protein